MFVFSGCVGPKYHVDYDGRMAAYEGAKDGYHAKETVSLYYQADAAEGELVFYLDDERLVTPYSAGKGYHIRFEMPGHDVRLTCRSADDETNEQDNDRAGETAAAHEAAVLHAAEDIKVNTQSSIRLTCGSKVIYVDPLDLTDNAADADVILITHDHYDHFSPKNIAKAVKDNTVFYVPEKMADNRQLKAFGCRIVPVAPGQTVDAEGFSMETVPSYNLKKTFHPKSSGWVGYILHMDGVKVYIAGDTDATPEAAAVSCDIAMVPIGGTYTMNAKEAAALVNQIRPIVAIPTHYGSIVGKPDDARVFEENTDKAIRVAVKLKK